MLNYPMDFINKAKALYPYWKNLHEALDDGSTSVGQYLRSYRRESKEKNELYEEWERIYESQISFF